ncbi:hypothetical protein DFH09DRAFT_1096904 [Mycena vulgaris]|nr:hypothetical protein DFH09DRAFT_1096904 [Mycena vulgaris]
MSCCLRALPGASQVTISIDWPLLSIVFKISSERLGLYCATQRGEYMALILPPTRRSMVQPFELSRSQEAQYDNKYAAASLLNSMDRYSGVADAPERSEVEACKNILAIMSYNSREVVILAVFGHFMVGARCVVASLTSANARGEGACTSTINRGDWDDGIEMNQSEGTTNRANHSVLTELVGDKPLPIYRTVGRERQLGSGTQTAILEAHCTRVNTMNSYQLVHLAEESQRRDVVRERWSEVGAPRGDSAELRFRVAARIERGRTFALGTEETKISGVNLKRTGQETRDRKRKSCEGGVRDARSFGKGVLRVRIRPEDVNADALKSGDGCRGSYLDARERKYNVEGGIFWRRRRIRSGMKLSASQERRYDKWRYRATSGGKWGYIGTSMARILGADMFKPHSEERIGQVLVAIA